MLMYWYKRISALTRNLDVPILEMNHDEIWTVQNDFPTLPYAAHQLSWTANRKWYLKLCNNIDTITPKATWRQKLPWLWDKPCAIDTQCKVVDQWELWRGPCGWPEAHWQCHSATSLCSSHGSPNERETWRKVNDCQQNIMCSALHMGTWLLSGHLSQFQLIATKLSQKWRTPTVHVLWWGHL